MLHEELVGYFRAALGEENAQEIVAQAMRATGHGGLYELELEEAMAVLDEIAKQPGLVGITARLASTRIHLQLARSSSERASAILSKSSAVGGASGRRH